MPADEIERPIASALGLCCRATSRVAARNARKNTYALNARMLISRMRWRAPNLFLRANEMRAVIWPMSADERRDLRALIAPRAGQLIKRCSARKYRGYGRFTPFSRCVLNTLHKSLAIYDAAAAT